ncbi:MAG: glycosyltransferase family 4 protein [Magnetococcales bacterium]|nr:glycosyltransferase family 4 protein [Magnetococcales bacterium]
MSNLKILTFSTLFPNKIQKTHGIFVQTRLGYLRQSGQIDSRVMAPVPWFPWSHSRFGDYGQFAKISAQDHCLDNVPVSHPRYPVIPKIGMSAAPMLMALSVAKSLFHIHKNIFPFQVIDAHYFYPDGVAAAWLGKQLGVPVVITARGTDINLIPKYALPRRMIKWAAEHSAGMITVCAALKESLVELGIDARKVTVLRNGVDLVRFQPGDRQQARQALSLTRRTLLSVGHLITRKGHDLAIKALMDLPDTDLLIAGSGPEENSLRALADQCQVSDRVRFLGALPQEQLPDCYRAADALILASSREGWANVLLESMACGTPVVASNVWGTPEVVTNQAAGVLMPERSPAGVTAGVNTLFLNKPNSSETRHHAEQFSWQDTTDGQLALFRSIIEKK